MHDLARFRVALGALLLSLCLIGSSCGRVVGSADRLERTPGSAIVVTADSFDVSQDALRELSAAGVGEVFVAIGSLFWQGDDPTFERATGIDLPRRTVVTLSIAGDYPEGGDPNSRALHLADELLQLKLDAETRGLELRGFHLDLIAGDPIGYGEFLTQLRRKLAGEMQLSIRLSEGWLDGEPREIKAALSPVDFAVLRIYGQPLGQTTDRPDRWEIRHGVDAVASALELGVPIMAEVLTKGYVSRRSIDGEEVDRAAGLNLEPLLTNRAFEAEPIFELAGFDRQVFDILAERSGRLGGLRVRAGERLRIVRPTAGHIAKLRYEIRARSLEGYLGEVYRAWPSKRETLSLGPDVLAHAVADTTSPELGIEAERATGKGVWLLNFTLVNRGLHPTAMALVETNYLEIQIEGASFGSVQLGDFHRYELGRMGEERSGIQQVRNANQLQLFFPMLDPGWRIASGQIEVLTRREPLVRAGAIYMLPDGNRVEVAATDWQALVPLPEAVEDETETSADDPEAPGADRPTSK